MANSLTEVIRKLEQQKAGIERALAALREIEGTAADTTAPAPAATSGATGAKRGRPPGGMTAEGRRRLSEALRARWAAKRAGSGASPAASAAPAQATRKGGMTPEGRRRLSEALKKRWAAKRAASTVKKGRR
jgi:hypothetical protein